MMPSLLVPAITAVFTSATTISTFGPFMTLEMTGIKGEFLFIMI